jgi:hypothetical protein
LSSTSITHNYDNSIVRAFLIEGAKVVKGVHHSSCGYTHAGMILINFNVQHLFETSVRQFPIHGKLTLARTPATVLNAPFFWVVNFIVICWGAHDLCSEICQARANRAVRLKTNRFPVNPFFCINTQVITAPTL